jgi:hypothetical protein|tara:strand:- start:2 stop:223 length:222 start_codon:yes stop_codon:yes gene_type:complete
MSKEDNSINYFNKGGNKRLRDWLNEEIENNEPVVSKEEEMADGTDDIYVGRTELAEALLQKLDEWDEEDTKTS